MSIKSRLLQQNAQAFMLIFPAIFVYLLFALYPMFDVFGLSTMKWNGLDGERLFVGLDNFNYVLNSDPVFWMAFKNTLIWTFLSVIIPPFIGFLLALGLNQNIPGRSYLRALYYLPVIIAPIAVATIWKWMFDPFFGLLNTALIEMGLSSWIFDWLGDRDVALYSVFIAYVWQTIGFSMVLFLAGLQTVNHSLIEAAWLDGANRFNVFRFVTLVALKGTITIVVILSLINSLRAFDIVYGMTGGGPAQSTQMLAMWAYTQSMQLGDFGKGSAISVILLIMTIAIVIPYLRWSLLKKDT